MKFQRLPSVCLLALLSVTGSSRGAVVLDQIDDANSYVLGPGLGSAPSQKSADFPDSSCMVLEDFTVTDSGLRIAGLQALFRAESGFAGFGGVAGYSIAIFSDAGLAAASLTGNISNLQAVAGAGVSVAPVTGAPGGFEYGLVSLTVDILLPAAGTYWLGIAPQATSGTGDFRLLSNGANVPPGNANAQLANPGMELGAGALSSLGTDFAYRITVVPEPSAAVLCLVAGVGLLVRRGRTRPRGILENLK